MKSILKGVYNNFRILPIAIAFKQAFINLACLMFGHKMETIDWFSDGDVNTRTDKCHRCKNVFKVTDRMAMIVKKAKILNWLERRKVIVEKHKNPKDYVVRLFLSDTTMDLQHLKILDKNIDMAHKELKNELIRVGTNRADVRLICLDDEEIPKELL